MSTDYTLQRYVLEEALEGNLHDARLIAEELTDSELIFLAAAARTVAELCETRLATVRDERKG